MKSENFQKLKKRIEDELKITESNIRDKSIQLSVFYQNCLQIFAKELSILKAKKIEKEKVYGKLYHKYKYNYEFTLDSKSEIDTYVKSDDTYYTVALEYAQQEVQVNYLEQSLTNINNLGFRIKNYIDFKKLDNGLL